MVEYKCLRCNKIFNHKTKFIKHVKRKYICKPKLKDISIKEVYKYYFKNDNININTNVAKCSQNVADLEPIIVDDIRCKYCNNIFKHTSSRYKHESKRCKVKMKST